MLLLELFSLPLILACAPWSPSPGLSLSMSLHHALKLDALYSSMLIESGVNNATKYLKEHVFWWCNLWCRCHVRLVLIVVVNLCLHATVKLLSRGWTRWIILISTIFVASPTCPWMDDLNTKLKDSTWKTPKQKIEELVCNCSWSAWQIIAIWACAEHCAPPWKIANYLVLWFGGFAYVFDGEPLMSLKAIRKQKKLSGNNFDRQL